MGTRGAFGVIIGEQEKIGYNQFDSYPSGQGIENLRWLRESIADGELDNIRQLAQDARLVSQDELPTKEDVEALKSSTNLGVSEQSTDDWYCLTRGTHGDIAAMLHCGYILDSSDFPLDSLFCEWAYIVDFDRNVFEVYEGFQKKRPKKGRWKGRPTKAEETERFKEHLYWCATNNRTPWEKEERDYKAVELVASWPLDALPGDEEFLRTSMASDPQYAEETIAAVLSSQS